MIELTLYVGSDMTFANLQAPLCFTHPRVPVRLYILANVR